MPLDKLPHGRQVMQNLAEHVSHLNRAILRVRHALQTHQDALQAFPRTLNEGAGEVQFKTRHCPPLPPRGGLGFPRFHAAAVQLHR